MLTFEGQYIGEILLTEVNQKLDCIQYQLKRGSQLIGTVYTSATLTLIKLPDTVLRVDRERRVFRKNHHRMFNQSTGKLIGTFEFPDWQPVLQTRCILRFTDHTVYSFEQNNDHKRIFKPKTWKLFRFDMRNSENRIFYYGTQLSGEIECDDEDNLLPITSGIFIIDEKFRCISEAD